MGFCLSSASCTACSTTSPTRPCTKRSTFAFSRASAHSCWYFWSTFWKGFGGGMYRRFVCRMFGRPCKFEQEEWLVMCIYSFWAYTGVCHRNTLHCLGVLRCTPRHSSTCLCLHFHRIPQRALFSRSFLYILAFGDLLYSERSHSVPRHRTSNTSWLRAKIRLLLWEQISHPTSLPLSQWMRKRTNWTGYSK